MKAVLDTFLGFTRQQWVDRLLWALITGAATVLLIVFTWLLLHSILAAPPIMAVALDEPYATPLCPGQHFDLRSEVAIKEAVVIHWVISVMDETETYNIIGTEQEFGPHNHPRPVTFEKRLPWVVPDLPPGKYVRVVSVRGVDGDEDTIFMETGIEIGEDCG